MNPPPGRRRVKGLGRVAFIANLQEITVELDAGWPIKAVYDKRAVRLGMSYAQFARYVDQIVRAPTNELPLRYEFCDETGTSVFEGGCSAPRWQ